MLVTSVDDLRWLTENTRNRPRTTWHNPGPPELLIGAKPKGQRMIGAPFEISIYGKLRRYRDTKGDGRRGGDRSQPAALDANVKDGRPDL
jgi:hypothetical protein